jgi:hypothetical protein
LKSILENFQEKRSLAVCVLIQESTDNQSSQMHKDNF